jgi:drug/metabolite transporter (DMT)-like permease
MAYLAVFPTAIAFVMWSRALKSEKTSTCSGIALLTPLLSLVLIAIFLKESITLAQVIGFAVIIISVFLNLKFGESK